MARPARTITDGEAARIIAADAMLTLAESNLRAAVAEVRELRLDGVPIRQLADRLGLSIRSVAGLGVDQGETESGPLSKAVVSLSTAREHGTDRRRLRGS